MSVDRPGKRDDHTTFESSVDRSAVSTEDLALDDAGFEQRYGEATERGRGGMGVVQLHRDERIGREVAMKRLRGPVRDMPELFARFVREARVQGQLEHPAIPPVYDLGVAPDGSPYFTMKRLRGRTLQEIVAGLADGNPRFASFTRRRLLTDFASVCLAIEFAHIRGVLHRDLKPANIMLGDYGEVYVLDWGVAKLSNVDDAPVDLSEIVRDSPAGEAAATMAGVVLGTPGYMAPEQLHGHDLGAAMDVYALGSILFEILTLSPLHMGNSRDAILASTVAGADARALARAPDRDVPPELEAACIRATATAPLERFSSVRALHDVIARYLDGDRDLERRRELAAEHAASAERILADATGDVRARSRAMREAGRALALDPENVLASRTVIGLMVEPPSQIPDEVAQAVRRSSLRTSQHLALVGAWCYLLMLGYAPFFLLMETRDHVTGTINGFVLLALAAWSYSYARAEDPSPHHVTGACMLNVVALLLISRWFGPFVILPGIAGASTVIYSLHQRPRWIPICLALGCTAVVAPLVLQYLGVLAPSYAFTDGGITILPNVTSFPKTATFAALIAAGLGVIIAPVVAITSVRRSLAEAEQRLHMQAWQLRQLVPNAARADSAP